MERHRQIIIGLFAGLAAGLMVVAGLRAGSATLLLLFAAPASVYMASLGWGTIAGIMAAVGGSFIAAAAGGVPVMIFAATLLFAPAAWAGHLANLGQPAPSGKGMIWYPLSEILFRMMIMVAAGFVVAGAVFGYDSAEIAKGLGEVFAEFLKANPQLSTPQSSDIAQSAQLYANMMPLVMPGMWLMCHVAVFHLSALIVRKSGKLARARDDIPADAGLPVQALALPIGGIAGMLVGASPIYEIGAVLTGVGIAGYGLVGLAEIHRTARMRPGGSFMVFASWFLFLVFMVPIVFFAVMGILRSLRSPNQPQPPANRPNGPFTRPGDGNANDNQ